MNNFTDFLAVKEYYLSIIEDYFTKQFEDISDVRLKEAMQYCFFNGGKRLRPLLTCACSQAIGVDVDKALPFAFAIECLHAQSLVHDDMPALDNDAERRGKPSCHVAYGQGIALLTGDALLNLAYQTALSACNDAQSIKALKYISDAMGVDGLLGGQALELETDKPCEHILRKIYSMKTSALFRASLVVPLILNNCDNFKIRDFESFADEFGILFQLTDDYLDALSGDEQEAQVKKCEIGIQKQKCLSLSSNMRDLKFANSFIEYVTERFN